MNKLHESLIPLAITAISVLIALVAAEFGARYIFQEITTTSDGTSYFGQRWNRAHAKERNSLGFREHEISLHDPKDISRIAVVGDSFTFGQGIEMDARFSNRIEKILNSGTDTYEVLNFGKGGAETIDQIEFLKEFVLDTKPDFILLQWFINDVEGREHGERPAHLPLVPFNGLARYLHTHSAFYFLANKQWQSLQSYLGLGPDRNYTEYMIETFRDPHSDASVAAQKDLDEFIEISRQHGIPVGIIIFPELTDNLLTDYPLGFLLDRVMDTCQKRDIPCVDLRPVFDGITPTSRLWVNRFDSHPSSFANELVTTAILNRYRESWGSIE